MALVPGYPTATSAARLAEILFTEAQSMGDMSAREEQAARTKATSKANTLWYAANPTPEMIAEQAARAEAIATPPPQMSDEMLKGFQLRGIPIGQQQEILSYYNSAPVQEKISAYNADPSKTNFDALMGELRSAPVNVYADQTSDARIDPSAPKPFTADEMFGVFQPSTAADMQQKQAAYEPESQMTALQGGLPIALGALAAPFALQAAGLTAGLEGAAPAVTGSAAAPFGYAGSTGVGAELATAAGLPGALGAAGASIPMVPGALDTLTGNIPTSPTGVLGDTTQATQQAALGGIGGAATVAEGLIPGISNADLLNLAGTGVSTALGYQAAGQAADTQAAAAERAIALAEPWRQAGMGALEQLSAGMAPGGALTQTFGMEQFQVDPGAAFREEQGRTQLENYLARTGQVQSGAAQKEAMRFGQGLAAQEYGTAYNRYMQEQQAQYNRLAGLAGTGQTAVQQIAPMVTSQGAAQAAGQMGQANVLAGGIGTGLSMYNQQQQQQQQLGMQNQWMDYLRRSV